MKLNYKNLFYLTFLIILNSVCGQIQWNNGDWAFACDFVNNDLSSAQTRGEDCSTKCQQTFGCTHYTHNTYNGGTCWMKKGSVTKTGRFL